MQHTNARPEATIDTSDLQRLFPYGTAPAYVQHHRGDSATISNINAFLGWCGHLPDENTFRENFAQLCLTGSHKACFLGAVALYAKGVFAPDFGLHPASREGEHWGYDLARCGGEYPTGFAEPSHETIPLHERFAALEQAGFPFDSDSALGYSARTAAIYSDNLAALQAMQICKPATLDAIEVGKHALHLAAASGATNVLGFLLQEKPVDPNIPCLITQETPLHCAARTGQIESTRLLVSTTGIDLNPRDNKARTPLHLAAKYGQGDLVETLLGAGADKEAQNNTGATPLLTAAFSGHVAVLEKLLQAGANKDAQQEGGFGSLHVAAQNGHVTALKTILQAGANKDAETQRGSTPLHIAALNGHAAVVEKLLHENANKEAETPDGLTPLHIAALTGHVAAVEKLLYENANKEAETQLGETPLHLAALNGHAAVVEKLLHENANIEAQSQPGATPLHLAAGCGHVTIVEKLLQQNANKEAQTPQGWTPLYMAARSGYAAVVNRLLEAEPRYNIAQLQSARSHTTNQDVAALLDEAIRRSPRPRLQ